MDRIRADQFLPLSTIALDIMLALGDGKQHGYSILQEVNSRNPGTASLRPGTLYRALARLLEQELIEESEDRPPGADTRRRYYSLTALGIAVTQAEAHRLAAQLELARRRSLLRGSA